MYKNLESRKKHIEIGGFLLKSMYKVRQTRVIGIGTQNFKPKKWEALKYIRRKYACGISGVGRSMSREGKGTSVPRHISDYCVVDLETTGIFINSADIVEISAIKVRNNDIVDQFSTLVNPQCHIPEEATAVNHITDDMVSEAPVLDEVIDDFLKFVDEDVIVGYNNSGFDMNILFDKVQNLRGRIFGNNYIDLLHACRRTIPELENHKLETLSKYYGLDTSGEHRALKDCYLTKSCFDKIYEDFGDVAFQSGSCGSRASHTKHFSSETEALRDLQKFLETIIADGKVTETELLSLARWVIQHRDLQGNYPFDRVFDVLDSVLADGRITEEELESLQVLFSEFVDPVKSQCSHNEIKTLKDKHVVITGDFDYGSRNDVIALIENAGGIIDKSVKKTTCLVVVGAKGSTAWKNGNYGGKIQKAMEYKDKGQDIEIVEEKDFIPSVMNMSVQ